MAKAIILSRVSTVTQELTSQTEKVKKEALLKYKENELIVIENKESAVKKSEEELLGINQMKEIIAKGGIETVYCFELSRLSRRPKVLYSLRDYFIEHNVQLIVISPYFRLLDPDGKLSESSNIIFALYSTMAENEAVHLKERTRRGRMKLKAQGKFIGGKDLFGYGHDKEKNFFIKEDEASVVREIFDMYISGCPKLKIAEIMRKRGLFLNFQSAVDCHTHIDNILKNESYTGKNGKPQIITTKTFQEAQKKFPVKRPREKTIRLALGRSFLINPFCPLKRKFYWVNTSMGDYFSYNAPEKKERFFIQIPTIDNLIWHMVKKNWPMASVNSPDRDEKDNIIKDMSDEIKSLRTEINNLEESIQKIEERLVFGKLKQETADKMEATIELQVKQKSERLAELETSVDKLSKSEDEVVDINNLDFEKKTELVRRMFASIHMWREKIYWWRIVFWIDFSNKVEYKIYSRDRIYWEIKDGKETQVEIPKYFNV